MIIDVHVHVPFRATTAADADFLKQCTRHGVSCVMVSCLGDWERYPDSGTVRQDNDRACQFAAAAGDCVLWQAYLNPQNPDWEQELDRCAATGASCVKLWVCLKNESGSLANTRDLLRRSGDIGLPVLVHTFNRTDPNLPGEITISEFAELAVASPETTMIAAHAAADWRQCIGVLTGLRPNVCVDISGSYPERGMVDALAADIGPERVLFGSDAPGRSVPSQIAKVVFSELSAAAQQLVLADNARRLFGLPDGPPIGFRELDATDNRWPGPAEDHFCFCGVSPLFRADCPGPAELAETLGQWGVGMGYATDLGNLFARNLASANAEFATVCAELPRVMPLAVVNPCSPAWVDVLNAVPTDAAGVFVSPYLHNWCLADAKSRPFFGECAGCGVTVFVNCALSDHRFRHVDACFRPVTGDEVAAFVAGLPTTARIVFQGLEPAVVRRVLEQQRVDGTGASCRFEISRLTDKGTHLTGIVADHGIDRLVFGSEFPFRHPLEVGWTARKLLQWQV